MRIRKPAGWKINQDLTVRMSAEGDLCFFFKALNGDKHSPNNRIKQIIPSSVKWKDVSIQRWSDSPPDPTCLPHRPASK